MKKTLIAIALMSAMAAYATGQPPSNPTGGNANSTSGSKSGAVSGSVSGSKSGATSDSTSGSTSDSTSGATVGDISNDARGGSVQDSSSVNARAWSLFLPPSVYTPPMPRPEVPMGCPAPTETQSSLEVGKGILFSKADSLRDNDPCTAIKYSQLLWDRCQYKKADRALNIGLKLFAKKADEPWDASEDPNLTDFKPAECEALRNPAPVVHTVTNYVQDIPRRCDVEPSKKAATKRKKVVKACS